MYEPREGQKRPERTRTKRIQPRRIELLPHPWQGCMIPFHHSCCGKLKNLKDGLDLHIIYLYSVFIDHLHSRCPPSPPFVLIVLSVVHQSRDAHIPRCLSVIRLRSSRYAFSVRLPDTSRRDQSYHCRRSIDRQWPHLPVRIPSLSLPYHTSPDTLQANGHTRHLTLIDTIHLPMMYSTSRPD
jgi:hypothetical protein